MKRQHARTDVQCKQRVENPKKDLKANASVKKQCEECL